MIPTASSPAEHSSDNIVSFDGPAGRLVARSAGEGPPLLLVHSINAAASIAEVAPVHRHFASTRTVFSVDLPGYGASAKPDIAYTPRLMTDAIHCTLRMIGERCGPVKVDVLALSLGCEFVARAALENPSRIRSLALVSPTGFNGSRPRRAAAGSTLAMPWLYRTLRGPGWGKALFRGLTRPSVIRYFLRKTFGSQTIDEALWEAAVATARQPDAQWAPLCFLGGGLFSADIFNVYEQIELPVWMSHGIRGDFTDYRLTSLIEGRQNWRVTRFTTGAMPYFESPADFFAEYERFLDRG